MTPATAPVRKEPRFVRLAPRDLYFASHHQAAHVVVAMMLGCRVDHVEIGITPEEPGWCLDTTPQGDIDTVCAAGYAMEILLGRRHDLAWTNCRSDLAAIATIHRERGELALDSDGAKKRFMNGAELSQAILTHPYVRAKIDALAEALSDLHLEGEGRMDGATVFAVSDSVVNPAH